MADGEIRRRSITAPARRIKNLDAGHDDGVSSQPAMLSKVKTGDEVKFKLGKVVTVAGGEVNETTWTGLNRV
jgi:hypothetical protein